MKRIAKALSFCFCVMITFEKSANAESLLLDQFNTIVPLDGGGFVRSGTRHAQTFRVGVGGILTTVDFTVYRPPDWDLPNAPLRVDLYDTTATGLPGSRVLASMFLNAAELSPQYDSFAQIDFANAALPVTPGQSLAIVLSTTATVGTYRVSATSEYGQDGYVPGAGYVDYGTGWQKPFEGIPEWDYGFRTYVLVPEPSVTVIGLMALVGSFLSLSRRALLRR